MAAHIESRSSASAPGESADGRPLANPAGGVAHGVAALIRDALIFIALYLLLDWASSVYPLGPFNIAPWNPPPALSIVWLLLVGLRRAPVVWCAMILADALVRGSPGGFYLTVLTSLVLTACYAGMAEALRRVLEDDPRIRSIRQLWLFGAVIAVGSAVAATLYVGILGMDGFLDADEFWRSAIGFWLGDMVGELITAPVLLALADPEGRARLRGSFRKPETAAQFIALCACLFAVFGEASGTFRYFYITFLPVIWIALRGGFHMAAFAAAVVQVGVIVGAQYGGMETLVVVELQARVATLALTGLLLGIMVDEGARAAERLRRSQRLAAAGEMAGAIAHELNQPLAALTNYARACELIMERAKGSIASGPPAEFNTTMHKLLEESRRASEVVRRLRNLFSRGDTHLERTGIDTLLERIREIGVELAGTPGGAGAQSADGPEDRDSGHAQVDFRVADPPEALTLLVDRLQIDMILRNLLANAFESVASQPAHERRVSVSVEVNGDHVSIRIADSGPGVAPSQREHLFEPFRSSKASGMGVGLAVSRAIAEAHGGTLAAAPATAGDFAMILTLPCRKNGIHET